MSVVDNPNPFAANCLLPQSTAIAAVAAGDVVLRQYESFDNYLENM